jgi:hypothetical protein
MRCPLGDRSKFAALAALAVRAKRLALVQISISHKKLSAFSFAASVSSTKPFRL